MHIETPTQQAAREKREAHMARVRKKFRLKVPAESKRQACAEHTPWSQADAFRAAGYFAVPVEHAQLERGHEFPAGAGAIPLITKATWAHGNIGEPYDPSLYTVGIVPSIVPLLGNPESAVIAHRTRCGIIRVDIHTDKRAASDVLQVIEAYCPGAPIRLEIGSCRALAVFRIDAADNPFNYAKSSDPLSLKGDTGMRSNEIKIEGSHTAFVPDGTRWTWKGGRDLLKVPRAALPYLTEASAAEMFKYCVGAMKAHAPAPKLTAAQKKFARKYA